MKDIIIESGKLNSKEGSKLNAAALDYMAYTLVGSKDDILIEKTLDTLWKTQYNRFSHQYSYEAKVDGKTVGVMSCYPAEEMGELGILTVKQLFKIRKLDLLWYAMTHLGDVSSLLFLKEGKKGEFHIGTLATSGECRGMGIGTKMLKFAEEKAREMRYKKCSLTVKKENAGAIKLYKRLGYQIVESVDRKPYFLYRMVKHLNPVTQS